MKKTKNIKISEFSKFRNFLSPKGDVQIPEFLESERSEGDVQRELFIGIDLGGKEKKTTGICILEGAGERVINYIDSCRSCRDVFGREVLKKIKGYLKETRVIAVDAPLTKGRGKGEMRLYEKFLSTEIFRKERVNPIPPVLMPELSGLAGELVGELKKEGFALDLNLIEVFPTLVMKISKPGLFFGNLKDSNEMKNCQTEHQKSALVCAILAFLHYRFKTRYLGYKDGFLILPEMSFWKKRWIEKFSRAWKKKLPLRYKYLRTNLFSPLSFRDF